MIFFIITFFYLYPDIMDQFQCTWMLGRQTLRLLPVLWGFYLYYSYLSGFFILNALGFCISASLLSDFFYVQNRRDLILSFFDIFMLCIMICINIFWSDCFFPKKFLFLIKLTNLIDKMSHLRDLQRLRNTKYNFQIKRNNMPPAQLRLNDIRRPRFSNHNNEAIIMPEIITPKLFEVDPQQEIDPYTKYLNSKEILTSRESKDQPRTSDKMKQHKRGGSFGISGTYYDTKSKQIPQSGLSVYNISLKLGNTQSGTTPSTQVSKKSSNPLTSRKEKVPELFVNQDFSPTLRQSKQIKIKRERERLKDMDENYLVGKNAFEVMYPIGKGGFGKVWKVRCKRTGQIFAMKQMQKSKIINKKSINSVMNQRSLLADLQHSFLVNMKSSFQDRENLYLVMDYLNGGDLRYHIGCKGKFSQAETKFFLANIIIGLQYLHERKIIHRDLKPQNFVLDSEGYLRITDLGVSRVVRDDNHQDTSGTPGYMAPEVICHKNHTFTADYFALGVMGYEFMLGRRPYNGRNRKQIRQHILTKQAEVKIDELPYKWSPKAADFFNQLLQRNPEKRLGWNGIQEIKNHPWLSDVDWKGLRDKTIRSPFIPLSIEQNYEDYKEQISEDTIDENVQETRMMLRDPEIQTLFQGYQCAERRLQVRKKSLRSTNNTDSQHISLRGSGR